MDQLGSKFLCEGGAPGPLEQGGLLGRSPPPLPCLAGLGQDVTSHQVVFAHLHARFIVPLKYGCWGRPDVTKLCFSFWSQR